MILMQRGFRRSSGSSRRFPFQPLAPSSVPAARAGPIA
jgi:hypothetical protein